MKRIISVLALICIIFTLSACTSNGVKGSIVKETSSGGAQLDIMPQKLLEQANVGDMVIVTVGDFEKEMPFVHEIIAEEGELQLFFDEEQWSISICTYNESFCEKYNVDVGEKVMIRKK